MRAIILLAVVCSVTGNAYAQHQHHGAPPPAQPKPQLPATQSYLPAPTPEALTAAFPVLKNPMQHAPAIHSKLMIDHLEQWQNKDIHGQALEFKSWIGGDVHRLWLRGNLDRNSSKLESASVDVLYGHSISPWWDVVAGASREWGDLSARTDAVIGVQGLAPYKYEVQATAYLSKSGRHRIKLQASYDLLLTNRLILEPEIEANIHVRKDILQKYGSGLTDAQLGLRLRYEISKQFAPYIGYQHQYRFGETRRLQNGNEGQWLAGIRFWF